MNEFNPNSDETFLARWLAGELSEEELNIFESSEEFRKYQAIARASDQLTVPKYNVEKELLRLRKTIHTPKQATIFKLSGVVRYAIAASVLIAALVSAYYVLFLPSDQVLYQTAYGEKQSISLPDGSEVILNASSTLSYTASDWEENRIIQLQGEAFFKVTSGEQFTVETDNGSVSVLGTEFNVRSRKNLFNAVCFEGKIRVDVQAEAKELTVGNSVQFEDGVLVAENELQNQTQPSWMTGVITFTDVPLKTALEELTAQFGITVAGTPFDDTLRFTGSFPTSNASSAVRLVLEPFDISYSYNTTTNELTIE